MTIRTNIAGGPPAGSVLFNTENGTALAGSDYSSTSNSISFEAGLFATTVEVPIIVDQVAEGEEVFYGTLTTSDNVLITESRADIHVNDNDIRVWFEPSSYTVNEDAGTVTLTIRTNFAGGPPPGSVTFTTVNGTATVVSDYTETSSNIVFGENSLTTTVTVPIVDDSVGEQEEVFYGSLSIVGNANVRISQDRADINIIDNDVRVWFEPTAYSVDESAGRVTLIVRTNVPGGPSDGEVEFHTVNGTAI
ncbi:Extracellular matrix protein 3, partial [Geodia barretti]